MSARWKDIGWIFVLCSLSAITLNAISFLFVLLHTITWFNLAPRAVVLRMRGKRVPDLLIAGSNYAAWVVVSAVVAWLILRG